MLLHWQWIITVYNFKDAHKLKLAQCYSVLGPAGLWSSRKPLRQLSRNTPLKGARGGLLHEPREERARRVKLKIKTVLQSCRIAAGKKDKPVRGSFYIPGNKPMSS